MLEGPESYMNMFVDEAKLMKSREQLQVWYLAIKQVALMVK